MHETVDIYRQWHSSCFISTCFEQNWSRKWNILLEKCGWSIFDVNNFCLRCDIEAKQLWHAKILLKYNNRTEKIFKKFFFCKNQCSKFCLIHYIFYYTKDSPNNYSSLVVLKSLRLFRQKANKQSRRLSCLSIMQSVQ